MSDDEDLTLGGCVICHGPLPKWNTVSTKDGPAHEDCALEAFPYDPGDSVYPR